MQIEPELLAVVGAWIIRELAAELKRRRDKRDDGAPTSADGSGAHQAIPPEGLATRREVEALGRVVAELRGKVVELDKVIAVLKDRLSIP